MPIALPADGSTSWGDDVRAAIALVNDHDTKRYVGRSTAANTRRLMMKLKRGASDAAVLVIGDSTGNQTNEWVYLWAQAVAAMFPALTVRVAFWDETGNVYNAPTVVQTGTGPRTLTIWNCSAAGQTQDYVLGSRWNTAVVPADPDLVIVSHGHNTGDPLASANTFWGVRNKFLALTEELAALFPYAGIVLIAQNPSYIAGRELWQARKADMYEDLAALRGYGFIDVHQAFVDDGRGAALTLDNTHPTDVGSQLWADVVASATRADPDQGVSSLGAPPLLSRATNLLGTAYDFSDWSAADPAGWTMSNATATKDTTNKETGAHGMRLQPVADGAAYAQAFLNLATLGGSGLLSGQVVMFAVRLFMPAAHLATTRIRLVDNTGSANQILSDSSTANRDRFCWMFITKRLTANPTNITAQIYCRSTGNAVADITVDRAYLIQGALPRCG